MPKPPFSPFGTGYSERFPTWKTCKAEVLAFPERYIDCRSLCIKGVRYNVEHGHWTPQSMPPEQFLFLSPRLQRIYHNREKMERTAQKLDKLLPRAGLPRPQQPQGPLSATELALLKAVAATPHRPASHAAALEAAAAYNPVPVQQHQAAPQQPIQQPTQQPARAHTSQPQTQPPQRPAADNRPPPVPSGKPKKDELMRRYYASLAAAQASKPAAPSPAPRRPIPHARPEASDVGANAPIPNPQPVPIPLPRTTSLGTSLPNSLQPPVQKPATTAKPAIPAKPALPTKPRLAPKPVVASKPATAPKPVVAPKPATAPKPALASSALPAPTATPTAAPPKSPRIIPVWRTPEPVAQGSQQLSQSLVDLLGAMEVQRPQRRFSTSSIKRPTMQPPPPPAPAAMQPAQTAQAPEQPIPQRHEQPAAQGQVPPYYRPPPYSSRHQQPQQSAKSPFTPRRQTPPSGQPLPPPMPANQADELARSLLAVMSGARGSAFVQGKIKSETGAPTTQPAPPLQPPPPYSAQPSSFGSGLLRRTSGELRSLFKRPSTPSSSNSSLSGSTSSLSSSRSGGSYWNKKELHNRRRRR